MQARYETQVRAGEGPLEEPGWDQVLMTSLAQWESGGTIPGRRTEAQGKLDYGTIKNTKIIRLKQGACRRERRGMRGVRLEKGKDEFKVTD